MNWIYRDVRQALRGFRRTPVFTAVAIASLALGIGANAAIFSFGNAIFQCPGARCGGLVGDCHPGVARRALESGDRPTS